MIVAWLLSFFHSAEDCDMTHGTRFCIDRTRFTADRVIALRPITWAEIEGFHLETELALPIEVMEEKLARFQSVVQVWKERVA